MYEIQHHSPESEEESIVPSLCSAKARSYQRKRAACKLKAGRRRSCISGGLSVEGFDRQRCGAGGRHGLKGR